jgi:putative transposase
LIRRDGFKDNYKRVERIYAEMGLSLRKRPKKKLRGHLRLVLPEPQMPNEIWSMDFVSETLFDHRRFRCFTVVDDFTRESLVIHADRSLKPEKVVKIFEHLKKNERTNLLNSKP